MLEIGRRHRVRMELDAAKVHHPRQPRRIVHDNLLGSAARRKGEGDGAEPRRALVRRALLVERLALGAVHEALEDDGPVANAGDRARGDGEVVAHDLELGEPNGA